MASGIDGPLAMWDISQITVDNPAQGPPDNLANRRMVTLRLRATVHSPTRRSDGVKGEARRAVYIEHDPDLLAGFPIHLGALGRDARPRSPTSTATASASWSIADPAGPCTPSRPTAASCRAGR